MKENSDKLGDYSIPVHSKPFDENDANSIYLALFDNGEKKNSCRYKVVLTFVDDTGKVQEFIAPILNTFHPSRWLRGVDEKNREQPFYRQALEMRAKMKKNYDDVKWLKDFSCGFFYTRENGHRSPFDCAYAYMIWEDEESLPVVGVRFYDYSIDAVEIPENEYLKGRGPKWNLVVKAPSSGMITGW